MEKKVKAVIMGLTNSGKSSAAEILQKKGWPILEVDDEAQKRNGGIWPESEEVLDVLFRQINEEVLLMENVIFVTSFLEIENIKRFYASGFKIIVIHADYEELLRRKIQRDGQPKDNLERFNRNYWNFVKILEETGSYESLRLNTTGVKVEKVAEALERELKTTP